MAPLAQINLKTTPENLTDFHTFCARQGLTAYGMLRLVVDSWAAAERLIRALEERRMGQAEVLAELGSLVEKVRIVTRANGVFTEAVARAAKHYGIDLSVAAGGGAAPVPPRQPGGVAGFREPGAGGELPSPDKEGADGAGGAQVQAGAPARDRR